MTLIGRIVHLFRRPLGAPREVMYVSYAEGDRLIRTGEWQLAPEEDANQTIGWVYLERKR